MFQTARLFALALCIAVITGITTPTQAGHEGPYKEGTIKEVSDVYLCYKEVAQETLSALPDEFMFVEKRKKCQPFTGSVYVVGQIGVDVLTSEGFPWRIIHVKWNNESGPDGYILTGGTGTIVIPK